MANLKFLLISLLSFGLSLSGVCKADTSLDCQSLFEVVRFTENVTEFSTGIIKVAEFEPGLETNRQIPFTSIVTKDNASFSEAEIFLSPSDLIVGFDVTGNTKGHMYLIINGKRVDGRMFMAGYTVEDKEWKLSPGAVIRYSGLNEEDKNSLIKIITETPDIKGLTCVSVAHQILFDLGPLEGMDKSHWFPSKFIEAISQNGIKGSDGKQLNPEIVIINNDVKRFWNNLPSWQTVPSFIFKVLLDPYTWQGLRTKK